MPGPSENGLQPHLQSFTRMEASDMKFSPIDGGSKTTPLTSTASGEGLETGPDVFERRGSADSGTPVDAQTDEGFVLSRSLQDPSEELPIELISLADR
jgi:hypothetical protein